MFRQFEKLFLPFGVTKHACMLRLLCESAFYPRQKHGGTESF